MANSQLQAKKRNNSINPRQLRSSGKLPATLYGKEMESISIELDTKDFIATYKKDKFAVFELNVDNKNYSAVVKKVQIKPTTDAYLNVEFQHVKADVAIKMTVPVKIVGKSPAVKSGGDLVVNFSEMEIECLPANIPHSIDVDITVLVEYEDSITVSDVVYPKGVKSLETPDALVVKVSTPKTAEQIEAEEAAHAAMPQQQETQES